MFSKILIANRGEIAVRVMRACREMGIRTVAVYSEVDPSALHVRYADEAYCIGPAPSLESYLSAERIVEAIKLSGAEAVHPGYGFLSENPSFVRAVEQAGAVFIGPSAKSMELMGDKISARRVAIAANAPVVPGTQEPLESLEDAVTTAESIGYPVMIKAASGGGGKGLRIVYSPDALASSYNLARSEAASAFKDSTVYIEKYIERPKHIEIQLLADKHGNCIYLGERECSIQRRNQKVIEECPSPVNSAELRRKMGEAAVGIAKEVGYYNAGTLEFLVDKDLNFYFLEMNTRLQVEHPVTELVTGVDLVKEQIKIAAGETLKIAQEDIVLRGVAIECRVYAEDPWHNFMPSPGKITHLQVPSGPGIRDDSGIYSGFEVPIYYDPLLSKLAAWGRTREEAIARLERAISEYQVDGIRTNLEFFKIILKNEAFRRGEIDTGFLGRHWHPQQHQAAEDDNTKKDLATIVALLEHLAKVNPIQESSSQPQSAWKISGRARKHFGGM
ncbi:MAG: acetyl-CoA carboxylase biotin carboxylase subunit [Blastocatellia bacterium]|nr:acetyl-CoA carboxylase biotin carboxylase subunit [Blastocatellia bacterium]